MYCIVYINTWSTVAKPDIVCILKIKETQSVLVTIMEVQPRASTGTEGKSSDDIVYEAAQAILDSLIVKLDQDEIFPELVKVSLILPLLRQNSRTF